MDNLQHFYQPDTSYINPVESPIHKGFSATYEPNLNNLTDRLQISLDPATLLQIFTEEAAKYVHLSGIRFQSDNTNPQSIETAHFAEGTFEHKSQLATQAKSVGTLTFTSPNTLASNDLKVLQKLQKKLIYPLNNAIQFSQLQQQALKDYLTGLGNRASFDENFDLMVNQAQRSNQSFFLFLIDLDDFKQANDTFGHNIGDKILKTFSGMLNQSVRKSDRVFRFGGDEFALLLNCDSNQIADKVYDRIKSLVAVNEQLVNTNVGASIGYQSWQKGESCEQLFVRTDIKLYEAKKAHKQQAKHNLMSSLM